MAAEAIEEPEPPPGLLNVTPEVGDDFRGHSFFGRSKVVLCLPQFRTEGYGEVAEPERCALFLELLKPLPA